MRQNWVRLTRIANSSKSNKHFNDKSQSARDTSYWYSYSNFMSINRNHPRHSKSPGGSSSHSSSGSCCTAIHFLVFIMYFDVCYQVGLAVGDIDKIQQNALMDRYVLQVHTVCKVTASACIKHGDQCIRKTNTWKSCLLWTFSLNESYEKGLASANSQIKLLRSKYHYGLTINL